MAAFRTSQRNVRGRETDGQGSYLESVSDMMSGLLFVFILTVSVFAILFQDKTETLEHTVEAHAEAVTELTHIESMRRSLLDELARSLKAQGVAIQVDLEQGVLRLPESILFPSGRADLTSEGRRAVAILARELARVLPCYAHNQPPGCDRSTRGKVEAVLVEGHTDNVPIRNAPFPDNWSLSAARAITTYKALVAAAPSLASLQNARNVPIFGVSGYADQRPVAANSSEGGRRLNRRIDLRFVMVAPAASEAVTRLNQLQQVPAGSKAGEADGGGR